MQLYRNKKGCGLFSGPHPFSFLPCQLSMPPQQGYGQQQGKDKNITRRMSQRLI